MLSKKMEEALNAQVNTEFGRLIYIFRCPTILQRLEIKVLLIGFLYSSKRNKLMLLYL